MGQSGGAVMGMVGGWGDWKGIERVFGREDSANKRSEIWVKGAELIYYMFQRSLGPHYVRHYIGFW